MTTLNAVTTRGMLNYAADQIIDSLSLLTEVDSKIGDGDHGIGMSGGMKKVKEKLAALHGCNDVYELFAEAGKVMLMSMGGASGVIFGTMYMGGAKGKVPKAELSPDDISALFRESLESIKARGKAKVGDKTMVDALEPAVIAMEQTAGKGLLPMLEAAEEAAAKGLENTKQYQAKFGRAKSLMERAIGFQDAGATSVSIIFRSMREYIASVGGTPCGIL